MLIPIFSSVSAPNIGGAEVIAGEYVMTLSPASGDETLVLAFK
jgi:hypothetical protein